MKQNLRALSTFDAAALGVDTQGNRASQAMIAQGIKGKSVTGDVTAPAFQVPALYNYQSYFDDTLREQAILSQGPGDVIVESTFKKLDVPGYGLALHPSSETLVAVRMLTGGQQGASGVFHLKPGEVIKPQGHMPDGSPAQFSGFEFGLPFGWLGGGAANLIVLRTPHARVNWIDHAEVVYHRTRLFIYAAAGVPAPASLPFNWPTRFPWPKAVQGSTQLSQKGRPAVSIQPTRTLLMLRTDTLANAATMRCMFIGSDVFDTDSAGIVQVTNVPAAVDVTWGTWASVAAANYASQFQTLMLTGELERIGCNNGALVLVDTGTTLGGLFVDAVRYGRL